MRNATYQPNPHVEAIRKALFEGGPLQGKAPEPQEALSERILRAVHGDKIRHRFTCPRHGAYSIWIPKGESPQKWPHACPVCEHEEEELRKEHAAQCEKLLRAAGFVSAFLLDVGVRKPKKRTFEDFVARTSSQDFAKDTCERFARNFFKRLHAKKAGLGIYLSGEFGSGKTHLALAILDVLERLGVPGALVKTADLVDALNSDVTQVSKRIGALSALSCLVIDDLGASTMTDSEQKRLYQIVDARIETGLPTVFTSNLSREEIKGVLNGRLASRVLGYTYDLPIVGPDGRQRRYTKDDLTGDWHA